VLVLVLVLVLEPPTDLAVPSRARLDLQAGAGWRDDAVTGPLSDAGASGSAFSDLGLRGAWYPAAHVGVAANLRAGRFTLTPARGVTIPDRVEQRALDGAAAVAARAFLARLTVEGQLGYGYVRLPAAFLTAGPAGDVRFAGGSVRGHGLYAGASLRFTVGARLGLELAGEARPVVWGAAYGPTAVEPRWFAARGAASVDCITLGRTRWSVLADYQLTRTFASGEGVRLTQRQRQVGLGLRATWLPPVPPPPPPPPAMVAARPAPPLPGAISGVIHGQGNQPIGAFVTLTELGLLVRPDAEGAFRFDVPAGQYTLTIEAEGYLPQSKVIAVRPGEQHIYNVELQPVPP
jgi:hypothetical protein